MRTDRVVGRSAVLAGLFLLAGCGEQPMKDSGAAPTGDGKEKGNSSIQKTSEYKAEGLGTGYRGGSNAGTEPAK
jgi:hypothetical protein